MGTGHEERMRLVRDRDGLITELAEEPLDPRTLEDRVDASRATINRALRELVEAGLVAEEGGEYGLTAGGRLAHDHYREYRRQWEGIDTAAALLSRLPADAPVSRALTDGCRVVESPAETPYLPEQRLVETLRSADRCRLVLPAVTDPTLIRELYEHVVTEGNAAEFVVDDSLRDRLFEEFPRRIERMCETEGFELAVGEVPTVGLLCTETDDGWTVTVVVYGTDGGVIGSIYNDTPAAVEWGRELFERVRDDATGVDSPGGVSDGGVPAEPSPGSPLPTELDRQGFVRLDRRHVVSQPVAEPATAWRAGLDFPEVHLGYAVERRTDGESLTARLLDGLRDGADHLLVGPPGSGKSTTLKRVAHEWYERGLGPVFYRRGDAVSPVESAETLLAAVRDAPGNPLVVVEDAVRPDARAVFDAVERLDGESARFLFDAREREWRDTPVSAPADASFTVVTMPTLDAEDVERFCEHVERTVGGDVTLSPERFSQAVDGEHHRFSETGDLLLLVHRLAAAVDPLGDTRTTLEADVAAVADRLGSDGETDAAVTAALLTVAGLPVRRASLAAVTDAIEPLRGRLVFDGPDDAYRTVHETWAAAFLTHLAERDGEVATRNRVVRCVESVRSVDDETDGESSTSWPDRLVRSLYAAAERRPKLVGILATESGPSVDLSACSTAAARDATVSAARAFLNRGEVDRAESVFSRLPASSDRHLGLADVAFARGEYDTAESHASAVRESDADEGTLARAGVVSARVAHRRGRYDRATECLETSLERFRRVGDAAGEADCLATLGDVAESRAEYDRAEDRYRESLAIEREIGSRTGQADRLVSLGTVAYRCGAYERADDYLRRALTIREEAGDRPGTAACLNRLGTVAQARGQTDRATELHERSLAISRELDDPEGITESLTSLGIVATTRGAYERATERYEEVLDIEREVGDRNGEAKALHNLGTVAERRGEYERAGEYYEQALAINEELGDRDAAAGNLHGVAYVKQLRGDYEQAREYYERGLELHRETGDRHGEARSLDNLGELSARQGDYEQARERCEAALEIERECGNRSGEAHTLVNLGEVARRRGETKRAVERFREAAEIYEATDDRRGLGVVALSEGRVALADGRIADARDHAERAHETFVDIGATVWRARADRLLGRVATASGDDPGSRLTDALERFEEIGAVPDAVETLRCLVEATDDDDDRLGYCRRGILLLEDAEWDASDDRAWFREACPDDVVA
ncbi:MAG: tetratricopeptide repeat protein [Halobaculum sp.]